MKDIDKLRVMLPHWIEHNKGHGEEFAQWADKLIADEPEVARLLQRAAGSLAEAHTALEEALAKAGGPLEGKDGHKHGHHHHHDGGHHHHH